MKKEDLINAVTVLRDVLKAAKLAYQPADKMLIDLQSSTFYTEADLERAFIAGWMSNYKTFEDLKNFDFNIAYNQFKSQFINP